MCRLPFSMPNMVWLILQRNHKQNRMSICRGSSRKWQMPKAGSIIISIQRKLLLFHMNMSKRCFLKAQALSVAEAECAKSLRQRLMQEQEPSELRQSMVQEVQAGPLRAWDCTDMILLRDTESDSSGEMRKAKWKAMSHGKTLKGR